MILREKRPDVIVAKMRRIYESVAENEIAAESAADVLWENSDFATFLQAIQERSTDAFSILLLMLLTCINCVLRLCASNKETRTAKGQIHTSRSNHFASH